MKKQELVMSLLEISGAVHHGQRGRKRRERGEKPEGACEQGGCEHKGREPRGPHKLSPVAQNILCILLEEESMNQRTIAQLSKVSGQAVSEHMKKLEERELIVRTQGEINNENRISLTEKGRERALKVRQRTEEIAEVLLKDFTNEELEMLSNLLDKIQGNQEAVRKVLEREE
ncbi:MAG: winged helix-turn-helix transcriptional regulator [Eubacteriales bacterium]